jgi:hypothetical protein
MVFDGDDILDGDGDAKEGFRDVVRPICPVVIRSRSLGKGAGSIVTDKCMHSLLDAADLLEAGFHQFPRTNVAFIQTRRSFTKRQLVHQDWRVEGVVGDEGDMRVAAEKTCYSTIFGT